MKIRSMACLAVPLCWIVCGCGSDSDNETGPGGKTDAGSDAAPSDAAVDASEDGANDAGLDGATDTGTDGTADADASVEPGLLTIDDLTFQGAFRVAFGDGVSDTNYAVGTLAYNPDRSSLFIAGHAQKNAIAEFAIPQPSMATEVAALPVVEESLQPYVQVLEASPSGNPEGINRVTGMLWLDGQLLVNAENWYDAPGQNEDTTLVVRDATDLVGAVDGYFELAGAAHAGGYMAPIPSEWQSALGGPFLTGWASNYSIISRYSVGPSLFAFEPNDILDSQSGATGPVATTRHMDFPHGGGHYLGEDALVAEEGSASDLWNFLSRGIYGFVVPGTRTFAVFGSSGGVNSGIGYKITQNNGNLCGGYCAYDATDYYNYYWFFDVDEILAASETFEPRPYAYGPWPVPFDDGGRHHIIGGTFDPATMTLYLSLENAGQVGDYDRPPVILVFSL